MLDVVVPIAHVGISAEKRKTKEIPRKAGGFLSFGRIKLLRLVCMIAVFTDKAPFIF